VWRRLIQRSRETESRGGGRVEVGDLLDLVGAGTDHQQADQVQATGDPIAHVLPPRRLTIGPDGHHPLDGTTVRRDRREEAAGAEEEGQEEGEAEEGRGRSYRARPLGCEIFSFKSFSVPQPRHCQPGL